MTAMLAAALWLAPSATPVAHAQEATASCGSGPLDGRTQKVVDAILGVLSETDCSAVTTADLNGITGTMEIRYKSLNSLLSDDFEGLSSLQQLNLHGNDLTELPRGVFDGLSSLTHLRLWDNDLTTLPDGAFDDLSNLEFIRLNRNQLEWLPPDLFEETPNLTGLHMDANDQLACIHASQFDGLSSLELLELHNTPLGNINPTHFTRWSLNSLTELRFGGTLIADSSLNFADYQAVLPALVEANTRVDSGGFTDPICPSLEQLADCGAGNPLHGRTQKVVDNITTALAEPDCSAVTVQRLENAGSLTFILRNQRLRSLQEGDFDNLTSLHTLYMENNWLTTLPEDVFDGTPNLERLHLENNRLTDLPEDVFDGLSSLEQLRMNGNELTDLPEEVFDGLSSLEILRLNGNSALGALPPEVFDGLSSLQELYLNGNRSMTCIHAGQFDGLSSLQELHLSNTGFGNIAPTYGSRWGLNRLEELSFGNTDIGDSPLSFADYRDVFPNLVEPRFRVTSTAELSDPICGSIAADAAGSNDGTVRVLLEETRVRPNRARVSDAALLGDGVCGSDATATRHVLWTWQRSADEVVWTDLPSDRQPPDYGSQGRIDGECSFLYTPQSDDDGMYVRAYVLVDTAGVGANNYPTAAFGPLDVQ